MKRFLTVVLLGIMAIGLTGCKEEETSTTAAGFNKDLVKEYVTTYEGGKEYQISTEMMNFDSVSMNTQYFYRVYDSGNDEFLYYTITDTLLATQENKSNTAYDDYQSSYNFNGVIAIEMDESYELYFYDGTYLGSYDLLMNDFRTYTSYDEVNGESIQTFRVIWNNEEIHHVIYYRDEYRFEHFSEEEYPDFSVFDYIYYGLADTDGNELIYKEAIPLFTVDSEYYFTYSSDSVYIYDENDMLINSVNSNMFYGVPIIIGSKMIVQVEVDGTEEDYTFIENGQKYKLTSYIYDLLTDEYTEIELDYVLYPSYDFEPAAEFKGVRIKRILPGNILSGSLEQVLINDKAEIVSELYDFNEYTIYSDGYFYSDSENSIYTEDLKLISNLVRDYSPKYQTFYIKDYQHNEGIYNVDGEVLVPLGEYEVLEFAEDAVLLKKDDEFYIYDFATDSIGPFENGRIVYEGDIIVISIDEELNKMYLLDATDYSLITSYTLDDADTLDFYFVDEYLEGYGDDGEQVGILLVSTNQQLMKIKYTITELDNTTTE